MSLDSMGLLNRYFQAESLEVIVTHGRMVAGLAVAIAGNIKLAAEETGFIEEAAMLHDIGVCRVHAPGAGMYGEHPYIMHGILGREILEGEGLPRHALVCERHIGVGLSVADIVNQQLPLPHRDMMPLSIAEEIICFADLFFSKKPGKLKHMRSVEQARQKLAHFGDDKIQIFDKWVGRFGVGLMAEHKH
jgi:uncharacterized protein